MMKGYFDYMNNITVDTALHEKIMRQTTPKTGPRFRNRFLLRYAGIAACAAILALGAMTIPGLLNSPDLPNSPGETAANPPADSDTVLPGLPDEEWPLDALTLNQVDSQLAASIMIPGHFWYTLTDEQQKAVFPDFSFPLSATVNYRGDGSVFNVVAHETDGAGNAKRYSDLYMMTEIVFAPGEVVEDVLYEYEPKISDVNGIPVVAGVFDFNKNDGVALYIASFKTGDIAYSIKLNDNDKGENGLNRLTEIVNSIVRKRPPDLGVFSNPVVPELRDEMLTLEEARRDPDFGAYLPVAVPSRFSLESARRPSQFSFESARRFINQENNSLSVYWHTAEYDNINWTVSTPGEYDRAHIVTADEREKYDLSLYPIPRRDSVPGELWEYVNDPVFQANELSLDVIRARAYQSSEPGDPGWRMNFGVLYDDVLVSVHLKGPSPEQVWEMFEGLKK